MNIKCLFGLHNYKRTRLHFLKGGHRELTYQCAGCGRKEKKIFEKA